MREGTDMNDLTRMINEKLDSGERNEREIAEAILTEIIDSGNAVAVLLPLVAHAVGHQRREHVRRLESEAAPFAAREPAAVGAVVSKGSKQTYENPAMQARNDLLKERVFVFGEGWIPWGQLTIEQHRIVVDYYERRITGMKRTVARHLEAIAVLEEQGASCLNEII